MLDYEVDLTDQIETLEAIRAEHARRKLKAFVKETWDIIEPDTPLKWNWHLDVVCAELETITFGQAIVVTLPEFGFTYTTEPNDDHIIFNIPPGTMKSLLISVFWPAWEWAKNPRLRYLCASYGSHLSIRDNVRLRQIVNSAWYKKHFPDLILTDDQNAKERFNTTEGGWRIATSVGGVGTGEHPDRIIIDDPLTAQQARSDAERMNAKDWLDRTLSTRGVARGCKMVLVMQRLHEDDPTAHLVQQGGWRKIVFPMEFEPTRPPKGNDPGHTADPRDPRAYPGQLLWPELFTPKKVARLKVALGPYGTAGQLQQRPAPEGGGLFKREWFKFCDARPKLARRVRGWDTAGTEEDGKNDPDWTVGVLISEPPSGGRDPDTNELTGMGIFYIEDVRRERLGPAGVDSLIKQTAVNDGKSVAVREEKEGGSAGKVVVEARAKLLKGYDYKFVQVSGDKVTRAKPFRAQVEAGNVYIVRTGDSTQDAWIEPYIQELCNFPTGKKDDQVDGSSCSFNAVLLEPIPEEDWATW